MAAGRWAHSTTSTSTSDHRSRDASSSSSSIPLHPDRVEPVDGVRVTSNSPPLPAPAAALKKDLVADQQAKLRASTPQLIQSAPQREHTIACALGLPLPTAHLHVHVGMDIDDKLQAQRLRRGIGQHRREISNLGRKQPQGSILPPNGAPPHTVRVLIGTRAALPRPLARLAMPSHRLAHVPADLALDTLHVAVVTNRA